MSAYSTKSLKMSCVVFVLFSGLFFVQKVELAGLKSSELVIERVSGAPPTKSKYLSEDSGGKVRRISRKSSPGLNLFLNITKTFPNSTTLTAKLFEGHNNAYKSELVNYKKNVCDYLRNERTYPFTVLKDVLHLPSSCPVEPNVYKAENWKLTQQLPPIMPANEGFKLQAVVDFAKEDFIQLNIFFRLGRK